jgi:hypothetical protein
MPTKSEYKAALNRLKQSQAKYLGDFKKPYKKGKAAEKGKLSEKSKSNHRWKDWRETDGEVHPVVITKLQEK